MTEIRKQGATLPISWEALIGKSGDPRFERKVLSQRTVEPTEEEWGQYREAKRMWEALEHNPFFHVGGYDADVYVDEPRARVEYEYAESVEEWLTRCKDCLNGLNDD